MCLDKALPRQSCNVIHYCVEMCTLHVTALPEDQALPRSKLLRGSLLYVPHLYSTLGGVCTLCTHYLHMEIIYNINLFVLHKSLSI